MYAVKGQSRGYREPHSALEKKKVTEPSKIVAGQLSPHLASLNFETQ